ncbi:nitrate reductase, cytochrome c-type,periplasmic [Magnetospirillum gryphiswaldense MSR-1 v2]|uniref:Cytochrome c-type protein n=1 Tax=Magnetospirillum gryphiswaldense (strain DSM 6361 / JCM 21280 / NBRC 15271 / MSR-1) TaxID=431944 RepID=V6F6C3_MAGGM|nr:NapC/NirT family cytochrome c [Magnetospirillum gryphiswaldense]CDL00048.1 nitrate reductase, cytochrome c-type,periplasmic [Magnetospirillum gryphiswaldense MSR-1 v2]
MTRHRSDGKHWLAGLWRAFTSPSARWSFGAILIAGGIGGVLLWGGFNTFMEYTNTLEFCVSCHEMETTVYQEYKKSPHYENASGVRAVCADCHVPKDWGAKVLRKIQASSEIFHKLAGTVDTPEKFEAKRRQLAERVWATMKANNSRECRNCHEYQAMAFHKQRTESQQKMQLEAAPKNMACVECHKGIAHKFPLPPRDDE